MHKASKISLALIASAAAAVGGLTTGASATSPNAVTNGGFESTSVSGPYTTYASGADLGGWTVTGGSVDAIGSYWQPAEELQSLDLSGNEPGTISQSLSTVPGATYHLSFSMAGNPDGNTTQYGALHTMSVSWNGANVTASPFTFDSTNTSLTAMGWVSDGADVTATGTTSTLAFAATSPGPYGPALDNVSVTQIADVSYFGASNGSYTNKGGTVVQQALVTSSDPSCIAGRTVDFSMNNSSPAQKATTDLTGLASSKFTVGPPPSTATPNAVHVYLEPTASCPSAYGDGTWIYNPTKK